MELTAEWTIPVGGNWPLEFKFKEDDLPSGVHIESVTKTITPASGLTVTDPAVNTGTDGFTFTATAVTAGGYSLLFVATRSDGGINVVLGHIEVAAASDRTTLAANALITLADFRGYMSDEAINKNLVEMLINGVSQEFDRFCARVLKQATYVNLYLDGNGEKTLELPSWPAASLGTITEDGTLLSEGVDADFVLYTSDDAAYLHRVSGKWLEGPRTILLSTILLGYATVPGDIVLKCLKQCAYEYQTMKLSEWGETSRSTAGGGSVNLVEPGLLPDVEAVLKRYRRYGI
jgi:hypothetical protein